MAFYQFFSTYALLFTLPAMFLALALRGKKQFVALAFQLSLVALQIYSAVVVRQDRGKPHYEKGSCYLATSSTSNRIHMAMITEIGKENYTYAIYLEADPRFGEPDAYFIVDSRHPDMYPFSFFETIYTAKVDCPNVATKVL